MSPETISHNVPILEESMRIKNELIPIEDEEREIARQRKTEKLAGIRASLGYSEVDTINLKEIVDTRIENKDVVVSPEDLAEVLPLSRRSYETTKHARDAAADIIQQKDGRLLVIVGPCSIHNAEEAMEYAEQVRIWREEFGDDLEIVMRFYPEKPRSGKDWKGFGGDPLHDESDDLNLGIIATRMLACRITDMGVPLAMERLNANTPQFYNGLVAYDAIGARNASDQKAREYMSGTSSVVGIKNPQDGKISVAIQGVLTARERHSFLGTDDSGQLADVRTKGNDTAHVILRGSDYGPNYSTEEVQSTAEQLESHGLLPSVVVDASHGNSNKKADKQVEVVLDLADQISAGALAIRGVMIESNLFHGKQADKRVDGTLIPSNELKKGLSITDECVGLDQTEGMLNILSQAIKARRKRENQPTEAEQYSV